MVRRTRKALGLFRRLWSPFGHALMAGTESVGAVTNTAKGVVGVGAKGVNRVGKSITGHFNAAVSDLVRRRAQAGGKTRKGRKSTRRGRKATRKSRKNRKGGNNQ
jgi:hypothetical protein